MALVAGLALVALAVPRVIAAFADLPARPVVAETHSGTAFDPHYGEIAAESRSIALGWIEDGRGWADLGLLQFIEARRIGLATDEGRAKLEQSLAAHRRAVSLSPAQAYAWARLAYIELLRNGPSPRIAPLLERAIVLAPFDRQLAFRRLELCFLVWHQLDPRVRDLAAQQVRFVAGISPFRLAALARKRHAIGTVRDALAPVPALRRRVDYFLLRL